MAFAEVIGTRGSASVHGAYYPGGGVCMDETKELLKASFNRLEGLIGEVKELRYKIKDVQRDVESLRARLTEGGGAREGGGEGRSADGGGQAAGREGGGQAAGRDGGGDSDNRCGSDARGHAEERSHGGGGRSADGCGCAGGSHAEGRSGHGGSECGDRGGAGRSGPGAERELEARLTRIEERLDYLGAKWLELDEKLFRLQRRRT